MSSLALPVSLWQHQASNTGTAWALPQSRSAGITSPSHNWWQKSSHEMMISDDQHWTDWSLSVSLGLPLRSRKSPQSRLCPAPSLWEHIDTALKISNIKTNPEETTTHVIPPTLNIWNIKKISNIIWIIYSFSWIEVSKTNCYYIMFYIKSLLRSEVEVGVGQTFLFDIKGWTEGVDTSIWMTLDLLMR